MLLAYAVLPVHASTNTVVNTVEQYVDTRATSTSTTTISNGGELLTVVAEHLLLLLLLARVDADAVTASCLPLNG